MLNSKWLHFAMYSHVICLLTIITLSKGIFECIDENFNRQFAKIQECQRSSGPVVSTVNFRSLERCLNYAYERNGLAVNYSPAEASNLRKKEVFMRSCQILDCPDIGFTSMINDSAYDYYSFYKNLSRESICIKSIGVFYLFKEKMTYNQAITACQNIGGDLANVVSESRTNSLSLLISNLLTSWYKVAYIGLDDRKKEGRFVTSLGNHLTCYKYRAWGPGQPRSKYRNEDCVLLDSEKTWRVVNCKLKFPALCEIFPIIPFWFKPLVKKRTCTIQA